MFLIFALTGGTEFNALKKIVRICLNVIINEKSLQYLLWFLSLPRKISWCADWLLESLNMRPFFDNFFKNLKEEKMWCYIASEYLHQNMEKQITVKSTSLILISFKFQTQLTRKQANLRSSMVTTISVRFLI